MNRVFQFAPHLRTVSSGEQLFLLGERERRVFSGPLYVKLASLLDGQRGEREIVSSFAEIASQMEAYFVLARWLKEGYLVEARSSETMARDAFWYSLQHPPAQVEERLRAAPVRLWSCGGEDLSRAEEALREAGFSLCHDETAALWVVVTRDYLDPALAQIQQEARAARVPWLLLKPGGALAWIGPLFLPHEGPCWECLAQRLRTNRPVEMRLARQFPEKYPFTPPRAELESGTRAALSLAASSLAHWVVSRSGPFLGNLVTLEVSQLKTETHAVTQRPQCPSCGDSSLFASLSSRRLLLSPRPKRFTDDGGHRCATPEETWDRLSPLVSRITGAVATVGPVPERDHPLRPVYHAVYFVCPNGERAGAGDEFTRAALGKGRTPAQSRTGALCEAIERYSASFQGDEPLVRARAEELDALALTPPQLLNFSEAQYETREEWNRKAPDGRREVPARFVETMPLDWAPAWSLTYDARRYVPASYCYFAPPRQPGEPVCSLDPNGHAAGNCLEEAILQGFLELAERDAVGIWWYNRATRPAVALESFSQPYFLALEEHYRALGHRLWVLDLTNDLGIPAFAALSRHQENGRFCIGFGAHLDARLGVQRALTELNQIFEPASTAKAPWGEAPLGDERFLWPQDGARRSAHEFASLSRDDLRDDVQRCVDLASRVGIEVVVLDQTRPDLGLCAVKVIAPGLRHIWPRFGPGRLYDVPVRLGWRSEPCPERELNPTPLFL
jgi:ribosomal protein S12 methylthiotransferase accessory factor